MAIDPIGQDPIPTDFGSTVETHVLAAEIAAREVPAKPRTRLVTRRYQDGTVVETKLDVTKQPQSVMSVEITRPDGSKEVYVRRAYLTGNLNDKGFVTTQHNFRRVGQFVSMPPNTSINSETGEVQLKNSVFADPHNTRDQFPHVNDPSDDAGVLVVTPIPNSPDGTHVAFEVTLEDGTTIIVNVQKTIIPPGKTGQDLAVETATKIGTLPPKVRESLSALEIRVEDLSMRSEAVGRSHGGIAFSPDEGYVVIDPSAPAFDDLSDFTGLMVHELGHEIDYENGSPIISSSPEWAAAMDADNADVSIYAGTSRGEDFAETYSLWYQVRSGQITGPEAATIESRFENRFAILDDTPQAVDSLPNAT